MSFPMGENIEKKRWERKGRRRGVLGRGNSSSLGTLKQEGLKGELARREKPAKALANLS